LHGGLLVRHQQLLLVSHCKECCWKCNVLYGKVLLKRWLGFRLGPRWIHRPFKAQSKRLHLKRPLLQEWTGFQLKSKWSYLCVSWICLSKYDLPQLALQMWPHWPRNPLLTEISLVCNEQLQQTRPTQLCRVDLQVRNDRLADWFLWKRNWHRFL